MKKRFIAFVLIVSILLLMGGLYWLGYLSFHDYVPSFVPNPGTKQSNNPTKLLGSPRLVIGNIKGRFDKISANISNVGSQDAQSVNWSISVTGGIFKRIDLLSTGTINALSVQSGTTVITDRIPFGFGRLDITITAESSQSVTVTHTARGFKLLFFVIGVRS